MGGDESSVNRLKNFVEMRGGLVPAASELHVWPSTLAKVLAGKPLSEVTRAKLKFIFGEDLTSKSSTAQDRFTIVTSKLREMVKEKLDVIKLSERFAVNPSTIEKILDGRPVSLGVQMKILAAVETKTSESTDAKPSMVARLKEIHRLYEHEGTLEAVGRRIGVTRERVRQLLAKGSKLGLFEYKPFDYPFVPKEKLVADYRDYLSLGRVAKSNSISVLYLRKLLTAYRITKEDLRSIWLAGHKMRCVGAYNRIKDQLGHHPTTTELQGSKPWRYLSMKIGRLWGSFDAFREELSIPKPPKGSPSFSEDTRRWRETRQRLALVIRMQHLDRIRDCLGTSGPMSTAEIAYECGFPGQRTLALLKLLVATGEVIREGVAASTKYRLAKDRGKGWL